MDHGESLGLPYQGRLNASLAVVDMSMLRSMGNYPRKQQYTLEQTFSK